MRVMSNACVLRSVLVIVLFAQRIMVWGQPCATAYSLTASPPPSGGTYACGQSVTFCFTVTGWNSTNANWFHGIVADFGPGWDLGSLVPGPPPATCGASTGTWGWYGNVQGTSGSNVGAQGPGFFFDLNNDGDPGNNFGDFCVGATNWQFCWTINVLSPPACVNGLDLGVTFDTFGDSETGSWGSTACGGDGVIPSDPAVILSCPLDAGVNGSVDLCSSSASQDLFTLLGGTPDAGGVWTDPLGAVHPGLVDPTIDQAGTYTYTLTNAAPPCSASSTVTVTITTAPNAGSDAALTRCSNGANVVLINALNGTPDPGGTWTDPSGDPFTGPFDPSSDTPGIYTYTIPALAPCPASTAAVTINVVAAVDAGNDAAVTLCATDGALALSGVLGGSPMSGGSWTAPDGSAVNGTFDPSSDPVGDYTYTVPAAAPCASDQAVITVTVNEPPDAGNDGNVSLCRSAGVQALLPLLTGTPDPGGTWTTPSGTAIGSTINTANAASGTYTYTLAGAIPCPSASSTLTVTLFDQPDAGIDGSLLLCATGGDAALVDGLGGPPDPGGTWTGPDGEAVGDVFVPGTSAVGSYLYSIPAQAPCVASTATVEVVVVDQPDAGLDAALTVCSSSGPLDLFPLLGPSAESGGVWTGPDGTTLVGTIDPSTAASGAYAYTIDAPAPCIQSSASVILTIVSAAWAGSDGTLSACASGPDLDLTSGLGGAPDEGGVWTDPDGNPVNAQVSAATALNGTYTYTVTGSTPCPDATASVLVSVFNTPDAGTDQTISVCEDQASAIDLFDQLGGTPDPGGTWTAPSGATHSSTFQPGVDLAGVYIYTLNAPAPCTSVSSAVNITVVAPPATGSSASVTTCSTSDAFPLLDELSPLITGGGTWSDPMGTAVTDLFDPAASLPGTYTYTLPATAPCVDGVHTVTVSVDEAADAGGDGSFTLCSTSDPLSLSDGLSGTPDAGGTWTAPDGTAVDGSFTPGSDAPGTYLYTIEGTLVCPEDQAVVVVEVVEAAWSGGPFSVALCAADALLDPAVWLGVGADLTGTWSDPLGDAFTVVDPALATNGEHLYTITGTAPCPDAVTIVDVSVVSAPEAGTNALIELCAGDPAVPLTADLLSGASSGGTWTSSDGSLSFVFLPVSVTTASFTYTVTGTGACSDLTDTAVLTFLVNALPEPEFTIENARGCAPFVAEFLPMTDPSHLSHLWSFGTGAISASDSATTFTYDEAGTYSVRLTVVDTNGCAGSILRPDVVFVSSGPEPLFTLSSDRISVEAPTFGIGHDPLPAETYQWVLDGDTIGLDAPALWTISAAEVGLYPVCLIATDTLGCANSVCLDLLVDDVLTVYVPNAFTPDGDGVNELFLPSVIGLAPDSYELIIADRWGIPVFTSLDPQQGWNGTMNNSGELLPQAVYVWRLMARDQFGAERREIMGTVTLLK
jgi:gliding motility-associated-like protein